MAAQTRPFDEVLVVVRPEDEPGRAVVAAEHRLPLREVLVQQPGAVAARNAALELASGDVVVFLDDDAVPPPDWLERMVRHFEVDSSVGAVGGRDRIFHGEQLLVGERDQVAKVTWYGRFIGLHHLGTGPARDVHLLKGVNMSVRRRWLPTLRFDEDLRGRGAEPHEDWALSLAVRRAGYRVVYDPAVCVEHREGSRIDVDLRADQAGRAVADRAHNETYAAVRYLPAPLAVAHVLYALLVGAHHEPGLLGFGYRVVRGASLRAAWQKARHALRGRLAGVGLGLRRRRADRPHDRA